MNSFGKLFNIQIYGESHGPSIGLIVDGMKPGITIDYDLINKDLHRRRPKHIGETPRIERDLYQLESGVVDNITTGGPILIRIPNENIKSSDYDFKDTPRPSHTDYVTMVKYQGHNTLPGSGHFSGRLTTPIVIAGSLAKMMYPYEIESEFIQVGLKKDNEPLDDYIKQVQDAGNSVGAILKVTIKGVKPGLGEPFFNGVESVISSILYSIPGIKGVSFGIGFEGVQLLGSQFNDPIIDQFGTTKTNHSGGINGGITNGNELVVNCFIRPASSIRMPQETYNFKTNKLETIKIKGRHDAFFARRAMVVVENAIMIALADLNLRA